MTRDGKPDGPEADGTGRRAGVEGPVAEHGDVTLTGRYVAGHDIVFAAPPPEAGPPPFFLVDRQHLDQEARKPKQVYVARSPDWADVVHGTDSELRFIERDQTGELLDAVRAELLAPVTRGTDRQLHCLVVLGAPGSGKTTLVRRVAAVLAMAGECVIADFGVKTPRVDGADVAANIRALDRLATEDLPVLVLLDDPFFANSGWVELLHTLGRPQHQGVSVLVASPDFLFHRFAPRLFGKQVLGRAFDVSRPSADERRQLAVLHDRDPADAPTTDEDLLVVAMEAAAGTSFEEVVERIWTTLNDGVPLDPATDVGRLPWPVVAFAVVCYFHRDDVLCPEPLMHAVLTHVLDRTPPTYLAQELQELVTREGWHIFSVRTQGRGHAGVRLIGATHARVAREAWRYRPLTGLDVEQVVIDVSTRVPAAVPQLAELILGRDMRQTNQLARRFAARWQTDIANGTAEAKALSALVRELKSSRPARLNFRAVLRSCLNAENDQSWLAAWQLYHLAPKDMGQSERNLLLTVSLTWTLRIADLSAGPSESIEIAERQGGAHEEIIVDRLTRSLRGELTWVVNGRQVAWLLGRLPAAEVGSLLEPTYTWLERDRLAADGGDSPSANLIIRALLPLLVADGTLDEDARTRLLDAAFDWLLTAAEVNTGTLLALVDVAEAAVEGPDARGRAILPQLFELLCARPENMETAWAALLSVLGRVPALVGLARQIIPEAFEHLRDRPEDNGSAWAALLSTLGRVPGLADLAEEIVPRVYEWLRARPDNNETAWGALLSTLAQVPGLAHLAGEAIPQVFERLRGRPDNNHYTWGALLSTLSRVRALADLAPEIVQRAFEHLRGRPENNEAAWAALFAVLGRVPGLVGLARRIIPEAFERLRGRPEDNGSAWGALLATLGRPGLADLAEEIVPLGFEWLSARPRVNETAWGALTSTLAQVPALAHLAAEVEANTAGSRPGG
ncbi:MAG: ATP-binding protein [Saccharothrix sp.]|nr:ATP-binding protein [Saccharothrix sp.]